MRYDKYADVDNSVDVHKVAKALGLCREFTMHVNGGMLSCSSINIDNGIVIFISEKDIYPRYFVEVNLKDGYVSMKRFNNPEPKEGENYKPCQEPQENGLKES